MPTPIPSGSQNASTGHRPDRRATSASLTSRIRAGCNAGRPVEALWRRHQRDRRAALPGWRVFRREQWVAGSRPSWPAWFHAGTRTRQRRVLHLGDRVETEVVTVDALQSGRGVGSLLLDAAATLARRAGWRRLWLVTTNDNTAALRFYQRTGWDLVAFHRNALARSRALKPSIPQMGLDSIPIRHELELELPLPRTLRDPRTAP